MKDMNEVSYAKELLDQIICILTTICHKDTIKRFQYLKENVLFYQIDENSHQTYTTESVFTHQIREIEVLLRTHYCHFPPEKINETYEELKSIIFLSKMDTSQKSHVIIHELVHLLSCSYYQVYGDLLIRKVGINSYIYLNDQNQYEKYHVIYDITNELLTDYIANILNFKIAGKQILPEQRCFSRLSFDDYMNKQLQESHVSQRDFIKAYFENDISLIEDILGENMSCFEDKCLTSFRQHQQLI